MSGEFHEASYTSGNWSTVRRTLELQPALEDLKLQPSSIVSQNVRKLWKAYVLLKAVGAWVGLIAIIFIA